MPKGLIILGYPGVGKSSIAGWDGCIDLESHNFSYDTNVGFAKNPDNWVSEYCKVGMDIASQGFTVLMSTHYQVVYRFARKAVLPKNVALPVIFCPDHRYGKEWIERLQARYDAEPTDKNLIALGHVKQYFNRDMEDLCNSGLPVVQPGYLDYDLKNYIHFIRKKFCGEE